MLLHTFVDRVFAPWIVSAVLMSLSQEKEKALRGAVRVIKGVNGCAGNLYKEQWNRPGRTLSSVWERHHFRVCSLRKSWVVQRKEKEIRIVFFQCKDLGSSDEAVGGGLKALRKTASSDLPWVRRPVVLLYKGYGKLVDSWEKLGESWKRKPQGLLKTEV